jgi:CRP/FNR family cyclic AMP-dependent transcriptional regulator
MSFSNPPRWATRILTRLFSLQPGEQRKTLLLYGLHFTFWLGLRWGDTASYTLFLDKWSAADLSLMFVGNAMLALVIGLAYNAFADRVSNERLLLILTGLTIVWLLSVQGLLLSDVSGGPGGIVYPYFYLAFLAIADLTGIHILNYISDFYDIRTAKHALPFLLSAGFAGAIVAGISVRYLPLQLVPLAWIVCLVVMIGFVTLIRRQLPADVKRIERAQQAGRASHRERESTWQNLRAGFGFVRESGILRWLALSTLVLAVLMKLLTFQASQVFEQQFMGDPNGLKDFNGTLDWVSNIVGLLLPSLVFRPILALLGVGTTSMVFPLVTLLSIGALGYSPNLGTAITGRLTDRMVKKALRNPTDALLYNSVPLNVKNRARGFVNGLGVPLGTLLTGLMLLAMQAGWFASDMLAALGVLIAAAYVLTTLRVRREYGRALAHMLAQDELSVLRAAYQADSEWLDPATLELLYQKLDTTQDDHLIVFLAELLYDLRGRESLDRLRQLAMERNAQVRASIIRMLGADWPSDPLVRHLCLAGLADPNVEVRQAAVIGLAQSHDAAHNEALLSAFLARLNDPDDTVRATIIPPLMASGDFYYLAPAVRVLSDWLAPDASAHHRALALRVLFETGDERLVRTLVRYLTDFAPPVRAQAAELVGELAGSSSREAFAQWGLDTLRGLLSDGDESVRIAAVRGLGQIQSGKASRVLLIALSDRSFQVRRQACAAMQVLIKPELERALDDPSPYLSECAAFLLTRTRHRPTGTRARDLIEKRMEKLLAGAYHLCLQCFPLLAVDTAGTRLLVISLREEVDQLVDRALWLVGALSDDEESRTIRRSLQSDNPLTRANAVETLETITSPQIARLVAPLYDSTALPGLAQIGQDELHLAVPTQWQVFRRAWPELTQRTATLDPHEGLFSSTRRDWLTAAAMYALLEMNEAGLSNDERLSAERILLSAKRTLDTQVPVVRETAQLVLARLQPAHEPRVTERPMLTIIERMVFLKKVPVFQDMSTDELGILAGISEEFTYAGNQQILAEGERGDALHIVVSGKVAIQRATSGDPDAPTHLATLGAREYFAEMSLFDDEPYSADAVTLEPTELLLVRRAPLIAVIKSHPELALSLFRVLSQRLRRANELIAQYEAIR